MQKQKGYYTINGKVIHISTVHINNGSHWKVFQTILSEIQQQSVRTSLVIEAQTQKKTEGKLRSNHKNQLIERKSLCLIYCNVTFNLH